MADAKELINELRDVFHRLCENDSQLNSIASKLKTGDYSDAHDYSIRVGELLSQAFSEVLTEDVYPEITEDMARQIIPSLLGTDHKMISDACVTVQNNLNEKAGLGLKAIEPEFDVSRAYGLADKYVDFDSYDDAKWVLGEPVENFSQSIPDDSIRRNADFQWKTGMSPKIIRKAEPGACKWCRSLAGTYDYSEVRDTGNDVYRRHENCRCVVTYDPGDGSRYDVHKKQWYDPLKRDGMIDYSAAAGSLPPKMRKYIPDPETRREIINKGISCEKPIFTTGLLGNLAYGLPEAPGFYTVVLHGSPYSLEFFGQTIDADTLCAIIAQRADYKKGTPIRLIACYTGSVDDGVARYISNKLKVDVIAPTELGIINKSLLGNYSVYSGSDFGVHDGEMKPFIYKKD